MLNVSTVGVTPARRPRKQWVMGKMHATMTRLYSAFSEAAKGMNPAAKTGQSALARKLQTTPQAVKNWETRGISQRGAQSAQTILGVNATWILNGTGAMFVGGEKLPTVSQSAGPDPAILHEALTLLLFDIEHGGPRPARSASDLLMDLYRRIEAAGGRLPPDQERAFERAALARNQQRQGESDGIVQPARGRGKQ